MIDTVNALMIAKPIFMEAKNDPDHPLYPHVQDLPNYIHIEALQILYSQLEVFTSFFDSSDNFNVRIKLKGHAEIADILSKNLGRRISEYDFALIKMDRREIAC